MSLRVYGACQATTDRLQCSVIRRICDSPGNRWKRFSYIRPLHSGPGDVSEERGQGKTALQENGWEPWSDTKYWTPTARANQVDDKNIVMGDLNATLDAHRTANRLHKIQAPERAPPPSEDLRRLRLSEQKSADTGIDKVEAKFRFIRKQTATTISYKSNKQKFRRKRKRSVLIAHAEEYRGQDCQPNASWRLKTDQRTHSPWTDFIGRTAMSGNERLSLEIAAYERYMSLRPGEVETAREIQEVVGLIIKKAIPEAHIDLMGSYYDGLATPTSDIDFRLSLSTYEKDPLKRGPSPGSPKARKAVMKLLNKLRVAFDHSDLFYGATVVNAGVPIIKLTHTRTQLLIDIQVSPHKTPQQLYRKNYLAEYPTLRPLFMLLRSALQIRGLNTVFTGGLGSYTILIMIVYALKTCPLHIDKTDVGNQLLYLLKFYSTANLEDEGYSLDPPSTFPKLTRRNARAKFKAGGRTDQVARGIRIMGIKRGKQPYLLCLQDPAEPTNDLGRKSHSIKHVQHVFTKAYKRIQDCLHDLDRYPMSDSSQRILQQGILFPLVGANYEDFERRRRKIHKQKMDSLIVPAAEEEEIQTITIPNFGIDLAKAIV